MAHREVEVVTEYLSPVYAPGRLIKTADLLLAKMQPLADEFGAIAFRGSSGAALAYPMAILLGKDLMHSRKPGSHTYSTVEGVLGHETYCIIDDFVASGETLQITVDTINAAHIRKHLPKPKLTHIFLYRNCYDSGDKARSMFPYAMVHELGQ